MWCSSMVGQAGPSSWRTVSNAGAVAGANLHSSKLPEYVASSETATRQPDACHVLIALACHIMLFGAVDSS